MARLSGGSIGMPEDLWHGGDLDAARRLFPGAPEPWLDLSTGINPVPYPLPALPSALFRRLPAPADIAALEAAAGEAYGAADPACVVAAPGTQLLIGLLPRLRSAGRTVVVGPTYAEHAAAWWEAGHAVEERPEPDIAAQALVLVNPNNPDGRLVPAARLRDLAYRQHARGGWLVVDEAFADLDPAESLAPALPPGAVVLRSFGKAYGLAGLRLGFALAEPALASRIRAALGPWAVSGPAVAVGRRALSDAAWRQEAAAARAADARRLDELLAPHAEVVGGTSLFRLVAAKATPGLFAHLGRAGIWVRRFRHDPRLLRFGLPGEAAEWERLAAALRRAPSP